MSNIIDLPNTQKETVESPLDIAEQLAKHCEWDYERRADLSALGMTIEGQWREYDITLYWHEDEKYLEIIADFELQVKEDQLSQTYCLLGMLNAQTPLGLIEITTQEQDLCYRYVAALNGTMGMSVEYISEIISVALYACDRFLPALMLLLQSGATPEEAMQAAMLEPEGEA